MDTNILICKQIKKPNILWHKIVFEEEKWGQSIQSVTPVVVERCLILCVDYENREDLPNPMIGLLSSVVRGEMFMLCYVSVHAVVGGWEMSFLHMWRSPDLAATRVQQ